MLEQKIAISHYQPLSPYAIALLPISRVYGCITQCRRWLYQRNILKSVQLPIPVISVGNFTTGGTGKTPVVIACTRYYLAKGHRVLVLSRGYRATQRAVAGETLTPAHGDEAYCIQEACPAAHVWVGPKRAKLATLAMQTLKPDIIILDDGYQYLALKRSLDIVLIDGERWFGNGLMLPLGPLREHPREAPHMQLCLTKMPNTDRDIAVAKLRQYFPNLANQAHVLQQEIKYRWGRNPAATSWNGWPDTKPIIWVITGIAQPQTLLNDLAKTGCTVQGVQCLPDHYIYTKAHLHNWFKQMPHDAWVVTTQKDWVKWQETWLLKYQMPVVVADIQLILTEELTHTLNHLDNN